MTRLLRHWLLILLAGVASTWLVTQAAAADAPDVAADPALEARVNALTAELRCLVCQNQSIADSHADLAVDLKNQVREQLKSGRSEREIIDYMTQRYGDFVLYRPPFKATTLLLWLGPALLLLIGGWLYWRSLKGSQAVASAAPVQGADAALAERLLGEEGDEPARRR
ncbi:MAG: cytochrome c-type biogenesis protein CcmH [Proteobacteria bacterium]|nr:cytochrome c-type biogenesis protein CcmH [Pseudomonadota bacterium]